MDFGKRQLASEKEAVPCRSSSRDELLPEEAASKRVRLITAWQSYECCKQVPVNFGGLLLTCCGQTWARSLANCLLLLPIAKNSVEVLKEKVLTLSAEFLHLFRVPGELVRCPGSTQCHIVTPKQNVRELIRKTQPEGFSGFEIHVFFKQRSFNLNGTELRGAAGHHHYRVARRPYGRPALSELGVKVSPHPAQALRTPLWRRRGFETERR